MRSRSKIRVGVVGAGNITSLRHIPALRASGRAEVVGIIDHREERARNVAKRFGLAYWSDQPVPDWFSIVDAVTVGVPPKAHAEVAKHALEAGKHVLLEKPMTVRIEDAVGLVELAQHRKRILAVVHNFQFARSALKLKRLIREGKLGGIVGILTFQASTTERRLPVWHEDLPLGLFYDESPHLLYLLHAFGGEIEVQSVTVSPSTRGRQTPAVVTAHFQAGGIPAVLYNNFESPVSEWHFVVYGTRYLGVIDVFRDILVTLPSDGQHLAKEVMRTTWSGITTHLWGVCTSGLAMMRGRLLYGNDEVVQRFLDAIESGTPPEGISAEDGLTVLRLQHAVINKAQVL